MELEKLGIREAPWSWKVNESSKSVSLHSHSNGGYKIMDFVRWGMQAAQPRFCEPDGIMHDALELSIDIEGQEHNSSWNKTLKNNGAQLISAAPEMLEALIEWCLSSESFGGINNPKYKISKNIIEKATNRSWEEVKEVLGL